MCGSDECRLKSFGLQYDKPTYFVEPAIGGPSVVYVVYRLVATTFFCVTIIYNIVNYDVPIMWPVYIGNWTFTLITLNTILQAICVTRHYIIVKRDERQTESQKMPLIYKVIWILQNITYVTAPMVSFFYWSFKSDAPGAAAARSSYSMANILYIANIIYAMVEFFVTAIPVRILHFIHAILFIPVYLLFLLLIYCICIGVGNELRNIFIVLEKKAIREPSNDILLFVIVATTGVIIHCFVFAVYRLREVMYRPCRNWVGSYNRNDV